MIKTDDLVKALKGGQIGAAGLDVTDPEPLPPSHELYQLKNCGGSGADRQFLSVIFPHIGSANFTARTRMLQLAEENVIAALSGKEMPSPLF